jgi:TrmH family RNA methyltransferase
MRIADWFGIDSVICSPDCADRFNPKVIQASMGSVLRMNVYSMPLPDFFIRNAAGPKLPVFATLLDGKNLFASQVNQDAIIVLGNESRGIHPTIQPFITDSLLIPSFAKLPDKAESLNVAIAAGIVCAEFRARGLKK